MANMNHPPKKPGNRHDSLIGFIIFLKENKKWWLLPIVLVLALMSAFILLTASQPILPAIYCLF